MEGFGEFYKILHISVLLTGAQRVRIPAPRSGDLSSIPRTHKVERRANFCKLSVFWPPYMPWSTNMYVYTNTHTIYIYMLEKILRKASSIDSVPVRLLVAVKGDLVFLCLSGSLSFCGCLFCTRICLLKWVLMMQKYQSGPQYISHSTVATT